MEPKISTNDPRANSYTATSLWEEGDGAQEENNWRRMSGMRVVVVGKLERGETERGANLRSFPLCFFSESSSWDSCFSLRLFCSLETKSTWHR